jgi:hypothetical protein
VGKGGVGLEPFTMHATWFVPNKSP